MAKNFICNNCGIKLSKWQGKCFDCGEYHTISEEVTQTVSYGMKKVSKEGEVSLSLSGGTALSLKTFNTLDESLKTIKMKTGINELDHVLGGGIVQGSVILIGGEPGIGKSTLLVQIIDKMNKIKILYVTAEESCAQVSLRAQRLKISNFEHAYLISSSSVEDIIATVEKVQDINLLIIDSIQTIATNQIASIPGSISQVKATSNILINYCKNKNIALILIGHITKDGQIAGPKVLEHMVDCVLYFESDANYQFRILRAVKNRFGSANELGIFEMQDYGLQEITNPSAILISNRSLQSGSVIFAGIEGLRPILNEIQALVVKSFAPIPRRYVIGWDVNRLSMIIAVLEKRYKLKIASCDIYLTVSGGLKIQEPAADLAVAAALISAASQKALPPDAVFFGEINLSGDIRQVNKSEIRIKECKKMKFSKVFSPQSTQGYTIKHILELKKIFENITPEMTSKVQTDTLN